MEIARLNLIYC